MCNTYKLTAKGKCSIHSVGFLTGSWNIYVFRVIVTCIFSGLDCNLVPLSGRADKETSPVSHISYHFASLQLKNSTVSTTFFHKEIINYSHLRFAAIHACLKLYLGTYARHLKCKCGSKRNTYCVVIIDPKRIK